MLHTHVYACRPLDINISHAGAHPAQNRTCARIKEKTLSYDFHGRGVGVEQKEPEASGAEGPRRVFGGVGRARAPNKKQKGGAGGAPCCGYNKVEVAG